MGAMGRVHGRIAGPGHAVHVDGRPWIDVAAVVPDEPCSIPPCIMVDGGGEGVLITGSVGVILILILKVAEGSRLCKVSTPPGAGDIQGSVAVSVTEEQRG